LYDIKLPATNEKKTPLGYTKATAAAGFTLKHVCEGWACTTLSNNLSLGNKDYLKVADHFVAQSTFDMNDVWLYPFQDIKYKELGGKNWKKKPIE
jgi:hypothetical protein